MVKLTVDLRHLRCSKPNCKRGTIQRHHLRWETLIIRHLAAEFEYTPLYIEFVDRYYKFLDIDVVPLCNWHHAEIHSRYGHIFFGWLSQREGLSQREVPRIRDWDEAHVLMRMFRKECDRWLRRRTPGVDPKLIWPRSK